MKKNINSFEKSIKILFFCFTLFFCLLFFTTDPSYKYWRLSTAEDGIVENLTAIFCLLAGYFCLKNFFRRKKLLSQNALLIFLAGVLFLFVGLEEISWGQRIIGLKPIITQNRLNDQREINLHNLRFLYSFFYTWGLWFLVLATGIMPILTYLSKTIKKLLIKIKIPLMPKLVCLSVWLGFIFYILLPRFLPQRHVSMELMELCFSFVLLAYVFCDYFYLLKYGKPYDSRLNKEVLSERKDFFIAAKKDLSALTVHNKILIALTVFIFFTALPLAKTWRQYKLHYDQQILYDDPALTIIEGEDLKSSNSNYWFVDRKGCFRNKYVIVYSETLPQEGYISFKYALPIAKDGIYRVFLAGYPLGPRETGIHSNYCQYEVWVDGKKVKDMYQENYKEFLLSNMDSNFYIYYQYTPSFYITKLGEFSFSKGVHNLEFRIKHKPLTDESYKFKVDAIFLVPEGWKPKKTPFSLPDDLFSY